jgi:hypothetical protein
MAEWYLLVVCKNSNKLPAILTRSPTTLTDSPTVGMNSSGPYFFKVVFNWQFGEIDRYYETHAMLTLRICSAAVSSL